MQLFFMVSMACGIERGHVRPTKNDDDVSAYVSRSLRLIKLKREGQTI